MLRQFGPFGHAVDPGREDPRRPLPAADEGAVRGRVPGGMDVPRHPERDPARGGCQPHPLQYLPRRPGQVRRVDTASSAQPRDPKEAEPAVRMPEQAGSPLGEPGPYRGSTSAAPAEANYADPGAQRPWLPPSEVLALRRRLPARVRR